MSTLRFFPATERQLAFIATLRAERVVSETVAHDLALPALSKSVASAVIEQLLASPRVPATVSFGAETPERAEARELLASLPKSKFAVPARLLEGALTDYTVDGSLLFLEVKEYRGTRYLRRLTGSVGDFVRSRLTVRDSLAVMKVLSGDSLEYIRLFGEHFVCCGKCGAPLTDDRSRARFLGPDCAKQLGVAS